MILYCSNPINSKLLKQKSAVFEKAVRKKYFQIWKKWKHRSVYVNIADRTQTWKVNPPASKVSRELTNLIKKNKSHPPIYCVKDLWPCRSFCDKPWSQLSQDLLNIIDGPFRGLFGPTAHCQKIIYSSRDKTEKVCHLEIWVILCIFW